MHGEFTGVWSETNREIWDMLAAQENAPNDLFCELYRELSNAMATPLTDAQLAAVISDPVKSKEAFLSIQVKELAGERALVSFFEGVHDALIELAGDALADSYFTLLAGFVERFSLRYELRPPCVLSPTLSGVFTSLMCDLRKVTAQDAHLTSLVMEFDDAVRDMKIDTSEGRIKICIQKQVNLIEAIGRSCAGITKTDLGAICKQLNTWPHDAVKASISSLYGFASDYPGIRHGGTPKGKLRNIEMRDMVAMSILLAGYIPYLSDKIDSEVVYWRS